jgi:outer membrane protein OmpA-like peptidoglycan-associated protein
MRHFTLPLILVLVAIFVPQTGNAQASKEKWNVASWEPGLGVVFGAQPSQFKAVRLALGTSNLLFNNRVGVYYILEYRGGITYHEDLTNFYLRDLLGLNYSVNKRFSVHGGLGVFRKGLLQSAEIRGGTSYFNSSLRKEIGIIYRIPQRPVSIDLSYSTTIGPAATFRYIIPMKQKKLAPIEDDAIVIAPVVVETKPGKEELVAPTADTIVSIPVIVEATPVTKPALPVDTIIAASLPTIDVNALAKQSTTYYPINVDELSPSNIENLQALVGYLSQNPSVNITVFGYADHLGSESYNLTLSASRAEKVKNYLVSKGIQASRVKTLAYGELKAKGETEEERALNRCVEFGIRIQPNK